MAELDAKIEKRTAELDAKIDKPTAELEANINQTIAALDAKMEVRLAEQTAELRKDIRGVERQVAAARTDLIKWTHVFWATTALVAIGLTARFL